MTYEVEFTLVDVSVDTLLITEQDLEQIKKNCFHRWNMGVHQ